MDQRPRILVLFGNVPLYGNERANIETLDQLQQRGADVLFLIRREWTDQAIRPELERRGLRFLPVPYYDTVRHGVGLRVWWRNLLGILGGSWALLSHIRRFQATHLHVGLTNWVLNFLPALMLTRLPLVFRASDIPQQHHLLWRWVWRYTRRRAAAFVCDSNFIRDQLIALGAPAERCHVIYSPSPSRPSELALPRRPQGSRVDFTVLYVGQISAHKGVDILVEVALRLVKEFPVRFIIAGDYSWRNPLGEGLVRKVAELDLKDRVVFTGMVADIEPLYAEAHIHVAPSVWQEPYGITVVEAKSRGVPSIVFPSGGLKELVVHGVDGWVCDAPTAESLETALRHYIETPACLEAQSRAAKASLSKRLRLEEYGDRWLSAYQEVA